MNYEALKAFWPDSQNIFKIYKSEEVFPSYDVMANKPLY